MLLKLYVEMRAVRGQNFRAVMAGAPLAAALLAGYVNQDQLVETEWVASCAAAYS